MTQPSGDEAGAPGLVEIDTTIAHSARAYDYLLGGTTNFEVDRAAAMRAGEAVGGIDNARSDVRSNRAFLGRAVACLAGEAGVRQFLDLGTGIPNADNVHAVATAVAPDSRIVSVDNDPVVLAHAHQLARRVPGGTADYVHGDMTDPDGVLARAAATLDLGEPVAVVLAAVLHHVPDDADPYGIVTRFLAAVPSGSYLVLSHLTSDIENEQMDRLRGSVDRSAAYGFTMRSRDEVCQFFAGLDLLEPGVVSVDDWRRDAAAPNPPNGRVTPILGGVGRKP